MAVFYSNSFGREDIQRWQFGNVAEARDCFRCGEALSYPLVMWAGTTSDIYLHEQCAESLVFALARDVHQLRQARAHQEITADGAHRG